VPISARGPGDEIVLTEEAGPPGLLGIAAYAPAIPAVLLQYSNGCYAVLS